MRAHLLLAVGVVSLVGLGACKPRRDQSGLQSLPAEDESLPAGVEPPKAEDLSDYACPTGAGDVKVAFFDADSTLRVSKSGAVSANSADDVNVLPFVGKKIGELRRDGFLTAIVSNQLGVSKGIVKREDAEAALRLAARHVSALGGGFDYIGLATAEDEKRKPGVGMATLLESLLREKCKKGIDKSKSLMVGDSGYKLGVDGPHPDGRLADDFSSADRGFAEAYGIPFHEPTDYFGWKAFSVFNIENEGELRDFLREIAFSGTDEQKQDGLNVAKLNRFEGELTFRFAHYNIKELTTGKIVDQQNEQIKNATEIVRGLEPDILSINEVQYDLPDTPTTGLPGTGENMKRLLQRIAPANVAQWESNLAPANTGKRAKKNAQGQYAVDPNGPGADQLVDTVSFGTFPGQYSTGFATRFPVKNRIVHTNTTWADWDTGVDLQALTLPNGAKPPADMELFDKNFNDVVIDLAGREAHMVTFHTVPAFGFGGSAALNIARNRSQLEFLEWYLLGSCDPAAAASKVKRCETDVKPLEGNAPFIAVGDFNVDLTSGSGGADVLRRVLADKRVNNWRAVNHDPAMRMDPDTKRSHITYASDGVDLGKLQSELDYFLVSKHFRVDGGRVVAPLSGYRQIACHPTKAMADAAKSGATAGAGKVLQVSTRYGENNVKSFCAIEVNEAWVSARKGSDHLPIYVAFRWAPEPKKN